ncbi:MAG: Flp family type IVb pilin [Anaerolineae bacterium]|nr:Flp family type IVb pilin [Anaerolineae bacterium]
MLFLHREEGQGLAEYGLILVLVAMVIFIVLVLVGDQISILFSRIQSAMPGVP